MKGLRAWGAHAARVQGQVWESWAAVHSEGAVVSAAASFLLFHALVLKPNDHLRLTEPEGTRDLLLPGPGQILIEVRHSTFIR